MTTDLTQLYNLALAQVGAKDVVSHPTEESREAEVCSLWYERVRDKILRAAPWPCARKTKTLALAAERTNSAWTESEPEPPWYYAYHYPSDMIAPRYLTTYERFATGLTDGSKTILTNTQQAVLVYTMRQTNVALWDEDLVWAVAFGLAAHITKPLTGQGRMAESNLNKANFYIEEARAAAGNQNSEQLETIAPWHQARGYSSGTPLQYIYPYGNLLSLGS